MTQFPTVIGISIRQKQRKPVPPRQMLFEPHTCNGQLDVGKPFVRIDSQYQIGKDRTALPQHERTHRAIHEKHQV